MESIYLQSWLINDDDCIELLCSKSYTHYIAVWWWVIIDDDYDVIIICSALQSSTAYTYFIAVWWWVTTDDFYDVIIICSALQYSGANTYFITVWCWVILDDDYDIIIICSAVWCTSIIFFSVCSVDAQYNEIQHNTMICNKVQYIIIKYITNTNTMPAVVY